MDASTNQVSLFRFEDVSVTSNGTAILRDVTLELPPTGISVVVGPSGAGKTTMLRLCNRLSVPTGGRVHYRGTPLTEIDPLELRRQVGMVFQRPVLFGGTVRDNLTVAEPTAPESHLRDVLAKVHVPGEWLNRSADELSGGEAQRVCLARTLLTGAKTLLMDEPTASVDPALQLGLEEQVAALARDGAAIVWVTHDRGQMRRLADHVVSLRSGMVEYSGPAPDFEPDPLGHPRD